ncbi:endogenous retrovirus group 3 member 1 Env polyprotein-like, partial [Pelobates fuscus]|uniref:endogenous retrovirus group 3 member 1 Env polyprotein-like n=1 Tax=Pelobates fuscus TaxID=191477 RepID=UPI002FE45771
FQIYGTGLDPGTVLFIGIETDTVSSQTHQVYHSFYEEMSIDNKIPHNAKNLFIDLAESIAGSLNVTNCYVCRGTNMGDQWPWEAKEVMSGSEAVDQLTSTQADYHMSVRGKSEWRLKTSIIGYVCIARKGIMYNTSVGELTCLGQKAYDDDTKNTTWWSASNVSEPSNPFARYANLKDVWFDLSITSTWRAPANLYWICGKKAYSELPQDWEGACVLGMLKPSFFLLPIETGETLGVKVYDVNHRKKRGPIEIGAWEDNEWPPQRIIDYYGPATWAEDGTFGYRTPIYMLNRIIRLQAVVEIITNETSQALNLLAKHNTRMRTAVYQNRLALDYLLAVEGGVCGKFNLSNCCLQIDDEGQAIAELTSHMVKLAHVPTQVWKGYNPSSWFGSWYEWFGGLKAVVGGVLLILMLCLILPCLIPLVVRSVQSLIENIEERKAAAQ